MAEKKPDDEEAPGVGIGGIFKGLEAILGSVAKLQDLAEKTAGEVQTREFTVPGLGEKGKGVFGFSIRNMAGGKVKVEPFGNVKKSKSGPSVEEVREPMVDVFVEPDHMRVVAELPGVGESDITTELKGDVLILSTEGKRRYRKEVLLPASGDPATVHSTYRNGILELKIAKK